MDITVQETRRHPTHEIPMYVREKRKTKRPNRKQKRNRKKKKPSPNIITRMDADKTLLIRLDQNY